MARIDLGGGRAFIDMRPIYVANRAVVLVTASCGACPEPHAVTLFLCGDCFGELRAAGRGLIGSFCALIDAIARHRCTELPAAPVAQKGGTLQ